MKLIFGPVSSHTVIAILVLASHSIKADDSIPASASASVPVPASPPANHIDDQHYQQAPSAPLPPYDKSTRRMPSTPLPPLHNNNDDNTAVNVNQEEYIVDISNVNANVNVNHDVEDMVSSSLNARHFDSTYNDKKGIENRDTFYDMDEDEDEEDEDDDYYNDEEDDYNDQEDDHIPFILPPDMQNTDPKCDQWAMQDECNNNPNIMLKKCPKACLQDMNTYDFDLLSWTTINDSLRNPADRQCVDKHTIDVRRGRVVEDSDEDCEDWAEEGLCKSIDDKPFMLSQCEHACMVCIPPHEDRFDIGFSQEIVNETLWQETIDIMIETSIYMSNIVMDTRNTKYKSVRRDCLNLDHHCSHYAAEGGCNPKDDNYEWMVLHCAPTCQTCELLDFSIRCPIPENAIEALSRNGGEKGLHAMFERIVGERDLTTNQIDDGMEDLNYTSTIYSRPLTSHDNKQGLASTTTTTTTTSSSSDDDSIDGPWVVLLEDFLSDDECERLIELGKNQGYDISTETATNRDGTETEKRVSKRRTSTNTFCRTCDTDPVTRTATQKIATITGFPVEFSEDLQLLQYYPGQYYKKHHDYIPAHKHGPSGPRVITILLYLNDVEEGGATRFNRLTKGGKPIDVKPKKGSALLWPSVLDENILDDDPRTQHEALIVKKGMKYAANAWLHLRDEKNIEGIGCD